MSNYLKLLGVTRVHRQMKKGMFFCFFLTSISLSLCIFDSFFIILLFDRKPLYIPIPIPIPVPIYVPVPMGMYNFPSPFPVAFPMPIVTPFIFPVGSNLLDEMMKVMGEAKKKETGEETLSVQENHSPVQEKTIDANDDLKSTNVPTSPNPVGLHDLVADEHVDADPTGATEEVNFELEIPSCSISSFRNGSRKRSHSTSHFSLPATKRLRDIDCRSSSDSEESTKTSRSDSPSLHFKGIHVIRSIQIFLR